MKAPPPTVCIIFTTTCLLQDLHEAEWQAAEQIMKYLKIPPAGHTVSSKQELTCISALGIWQYHPFPYSLEPPLLQIPQPPCPRHNSHTQILTTGSPNTKVKGMKCWKWNLKQQWSKKICYQYLYFKLYTAYLAGIFWPTFIICNTHICQFVQIWACSIVAITIKTWFSKVWHWMLELIN